MNKVNVRKISGDLRSVEGVKEVVFVNICEIGKFRKKIFRWDE